MADLGARSEFQGWPTAVYGFFEGLAATNKRDWFAAHRREFDEHVLAPMHALLASVEHLGAARVFRLARDVRFGTDKTPYKTQLGATIDRATRGVLYLHVDATGVTIGSGFPAFDSTQLEQFRAAVAAAGSGAEIARHVAALRRHGHDVGTVKDGIVGGHDLKRVPRPYAADHPRADLLRLRRLLVARRFQRPSWLHTRQARNRVLATWETQEPLGKWAERNLK